MIAHTPQKTIASAFCLLLAGFCCIQLLMERRSVVLHLFARSSDEGAAFVCVYVCVCGTGCVQAGGHQARTIPRAIVPRHEARDMLLLRQTTTRCARTRTCMMEPEATSSESVISLPC